MGINERKAFHERETFQRKEGKNNGRKHFKKSRGGITYHIKRNIAGVPVLIQIHPDGG